MTTFWEKAAPTVNHIWASLCENRIFAYAKTKTQISCAVTAQLISAFVFATRIAQSLYFLNLKFQASSYPLWLHSAVCGGPGRKPRRPVFSQRGSYDLFVSCLIVVLVISHFGFDDRSLVLVMPVPGYCWRLTFSGQDVINPLDYKMIPIYDPYRS